MTSDSLSLSIHCNQVQQAGIVVTQYWRSSRSLLEGWHPPRCTFFIQVMYIGSIENSCVMKAHEQLGLWFHRMWAIGWVIWWKRNTNIKKRKTQFFFKNYFYSSCPQMQKDIPCYKMLLSKLDGTYLCLLSKGNVAIGSNLDIWHREKCWAIVTGSKAIQYFSPSPFMCSKCKFLFSFSVSQYRFQVLLYSAQESVDIELIQKREKSESHVWASSLVKRGMWCIHEVWIDVWISLSFSIVHYGLGVSSTLLH